MSEKAYEVFADGRCVERKAAECVEGDKRKYFRCMEPDCGVRVYLHLPDDKRIRPYFAAGPDEPHKPGCDDYHLPLFEKVSYLDQTGRNVDLAELMNGFRHVDRRPRGGSGGGEGDDPDLDPEKNSAETSDRRIISEARNPKTLIQLYGILKNPENSEYAGKDNRKLIVDRSTIRYHRRQGLNHIALAVCGRAFPPDHLKEKLDADGFLNMCLTLRAPYPLAPGEKELYYVLMFKTKEDRGQVLDILVKHKERAAQKNQTGTAKKKHTDKYLTMAAWQPYFETEAFCAYIGQLVSPGCFHALPHKYDCDDDQ